jgi:branched-subunit amino acid transport protein
MEGKVVFVVAMMLATYPVRLAPLLALSDRKLPDPLVRWLSYVPPAVFSAMVFPGLLLRNGAPAITVTNPYLWAALVTFLVTVATGNLSKSVAAGIAMALLGGLLQG